MFNIDLENPKFDLVQSHNFWMVAIYEKEIDKVRANYCWGPVSGLRYYRNNTTSPAHDTLLIVKRILFYEILSTIT
jgi:hypothetical protein